MIDQFPLAQARLVLDSEISALTEVRNALNGTLGSAFVAAVDTILHTSGHVVVSGIGKSGLVGRKIAATLASTGTPAFFLHPVEAGHGDLGMITRNSVVLALSWSGESVELHDVLARSKEIGVPVIGITSSENSAVARGANVALVLPKVKEACPLEVAPTSSTTAQLAIGDALALACLNQRGFQVEDFRSLHPAGSLGSRLSSVSDVMHCAPDIPLIGNVETMAGALRKMEQFGFGCVGVVEAGSKLAGIITDGDLRRNISANFLERKVLEVMTPNPITIPADEKLEVAKNLMHQNSITALFVVEGGKPVGLIHLHDTAISLRRG